MKKVVDMINYEIEYVLRPVSAPARFALGFLACFFLMLFLDNLLHQSWELVGEQRVHILVPVVMHSLKWLEGAKKAMDTPEFRLPGHPVPIPFLQTQQTWRFIPILGQGRQAG